VTQHTDPTIVSIPTSESTTMHPPVMQQQYRSITYDCQTIGRGNGPTKSHLTGI